MQQTIAVLTLAILMALALPKYQLYHDRQKVGAASQASASRLSVYDVRRGGMVQREKMSPDPREWKQKLSDLEHHVAFAAGTERPFTHPLNNNKKSGVYRSIVSGNDLFHSDHKYDSGTGWPSFYRPVHEANIELREDHSLFMKRVEVVDAVSGAHLGHVFDDGPPPTGKRYCINGASLTFVEGVPFKGEGARH